MEAIGNAFNFTKDKFTEVIIPGAEGYLFMLALQVMILPFTLLLAIPMIFIVPLLTAGNEGVIITILMILVISIMALAIWVLVFCAMSLMMGGMVYSVNKIKNGEKAVFGDVFKYGWQNKWDLTKLHLINSLFITILMTTVIGGGVLIIAVFTVILPPVGICMMIFGYLALIIFSAGIMPLQYLPFIIRLKEGTMPYESVKKGWSLYFKNIWKFIGMGMVIMLMYMIGAMIPFVGIIAMLLMMPFLTLTLLFFLEDIYPPIYPQQGVRLGTDPTHGFVRY